MPYCPKCNAEYQEGYTMCADCKVPLVDSPEAEQEAELLMPFFQAEDKKIADKLSSYFNYSDLPSDVSYDEENELYIVSIPPKAEKLAKQLYQAFYFVERENIANGVYRDDRPEEAAEALTETSEGTEEEAEKDTETNAAEDTVLNGEEAELSEASDGPEIEYYEGEEEFAQEEDTEDSLGKETQREASAREIAEEELPEEEDPDSIRHTHDGSTYVMKEDKYKDLTGTAWIFLLFGAAGLVFVCLNVFGVISVLSGWLSNSFMTALFLFFLYVAVSTRSKAKTIKTEIDTENKLTAEINDWLKEHFTEEFIKANYQENVSEELNYMKLTETIKEMLLTEFGSQNTAYLDRLIEDYYNNNMEQPVQV